MIRMLRHNLDVLGCGNAVFIFCVFLFWVMAITIGMWFSEPGPTSPPAPCRPPSPALFHDTPPTPWTM